jgi:hypothetical protein
MSLNLYIIKKMSEKTGNTEKLIYDFNTASNQEVWMPNLDGWYRVTSREFRSFNGKRRINGEEYKGPVYHYATNKRANKSLVEANKIASHNYKSVRRPGD